MEKKIPPPVKTCRAPAAESGVVGFETDGETSTLVPTVTAGDVAVCTCESCGCEFDLECPHCHALARGHADEGAARREVIVRLLALLTADAPAKRVGQRAVLLAHLVRVGGRQTQRQLAARLGLTPGRVSQLLNVARREFATLARL